MTYSASLHFVGTINHYANYIAKPFCFVKTAYDYTTEKVATFILETYLFASSVAKRGLHPFKRLMQRYFFVVNSDQHIREAMELVIENRKAEFRKRFKLEERNPDLNYRNKQSNIPSKLNEHGDVNHWEAVSNELTTLIFSYLSPKDLCTTQKVCTQFKDPADDHFIWKKLFQEEFGPLEEDGEKNWKERYKFYSSSDQGAPLGHKLIFYNLFPFYKSTTIGKLKVALCDFLRIDRIFAASLKLAQVDVEGLRIVLPNNLVASKVAETLLSAFDPTKTH